MRNVIDGDFIAMLEARDLHIKNAMNGLFGGNRRSKAYGSSCEFADFREYAPGDDLRRIDWNLYARFEKLYLRLFVDEKRYNDFDCKINLYEDEDLTNVICSDLNDYHFFLPKGDYYLKLNYCEDFSGISKDDIKSYISFYRVPIKEYAKGKVERHKNKYYISFIKDEGYSTYAFGTYSKGTYDVVYEYKQDLSRCFKGYDNVKDVYKKLNFNVEVKKNKNDPVVTFGKTENSILKTEANGRTYDVNNPENNTSSEKKKDTKKPTVKGVKNNKTYKKSVKFKVSDKSGIKKVTLNKKKIKVSKTKKGYTVKKKGKYTLKVWDKAGNVRTVKFKIKK